MENFIYILIGIAWVAYSLYSARQKAIQKQQSTGLPPQGPSQSSPLPIPGNQSEGKSLFDDILRELTGDSRPVPQVARPVIDSAPPSYKQSAEAPETRKDSTRYSSISDSQAVFPRNEAEDNRINEINAAKLSKAEDIPIKFDLRKAVIYSELLNPKYF